MNKAIILILVSCILFEEVRPDDHPVVIIVVGGFYGGIYLGKAIANGLCLLGEGIYYLGKGIYHKGRDAKNAIQEHSAKYYLVITLLPLNNPKDSTKELQIMMMCSIKEINSQIVLRIRRSYTAKMLNNEYQGIGYDAIWENKAIFNCLQGPFVIGDDSKAFQRKLTDVPIGQRQILKKVPDDSKLRSRDDILTLTITSWNERSDEPVTFATENDPNLAP